MWGEQVQCRVSDTQTTQVHDYTAVTSKPTKQAGHHHRVTDSPLPRADAEEDHHRHTLEEQMIADVNNRLPATRPAATPKPTPPGSR